jgi:glycosyltransferase involved in cell wall biosynthesis
MAMLPITVFTATYNRADTLPRVLESLRRQTLDPSLFEWLIVDDGSSDGTRELVRGWTDTPFAMRYSWQPNQGKHIAWNRAASDAQGELFVVLDSDDACVPLALERLVSVWRGVSAARRVGLAGILTRCQTPGGLPVGPPLPRLVAADFGELAFRHRLPDETWIATRTDVLRANPFPELRAPLVPEGALWHKLGKTYKWLLCDECLRVYFTADHGRTDQLSKLSPWRYAEGLALTQKSVLDNSWRYFWDAPLGFVRLAVHFDRFSMHAGRRIGKEISGLAHAPARALCWSVLPAACALYANDRLRRRGDAAGPGSLPASRSV